jgi:C1A family cysteine protease
MKMLKKLRTASRRRYNWNPDLPDHRDFRFMLEVKVPKKLPTSIDLRGGCSLVENQGRIGSCTANALAGNLEFLELLDLTDQDSDDPALFKSGRFENVSRLFIYYNERSLDGTTDQDRGSSLRTGIKSLVNWGSCREVLWDYLLKNVFKKPSPKSYEEARRRKIQSYYRIESLAEMKQCLALGYPFVFGFAVYESFESPKVAQTGIMPIPGKDEDMLGGHAVMAVGYDDKRRCLLIRNSWGAAWGLGGYFWMPYEIANDSNLSADFWTVRK